jgi:proteasome lid subunit RPN8/RPN11
MPKNKSIKANTVVKTAKTYKDSTWDSGLTIVDQPSIEIDNKLLMLCNEIQEKFPATEFSVLAKGEYTDNGFYVSDDYVIPKQEVTGSTVDYEPLDSYQQQGYNVVIHSHHGLGTFFSKTDRDYINCQFPCSVLYTHQGFTLATMSFLKNDSVFMIKTDDVCTVTDGMEVEGIDNITKKAYTYTGAYKYNEKGFYDYGEKGINKGGRFEKPKSLKQTVSTVENETVNALKLLENENLWNEENQIDFEEEIVEGPDCPDCRFRNEEDCIHCYGDDPWESEEEISSLSDGEYKACGYCAKDTQDCRSCPNNY